MAGKENDNSGFEDMERFLGNPDSQNRKLRPDILVTDKEETHEATPIVGCLQAISLLFNFHFD